MDAANGVGAIALKSLASVLGNDLEVVITHDDTTSRGVLNFECGADFVKMYQKAPKGILLSDNLRSCSLDGDADRIVFYFGQGMTLLDKGGQFRLLDGDKIATLAAEFIMTKIVEAQVSHFDKTPLQVGLIQTAYANGNSTSYVKDVLVHDI